MTKHITQGSTWSDPNGLIAADILLPPKQDGKKYYKTSIQAKKVEDVWAEQRTAHIANYFAWLQLKITCLPIIKKHCLTV